MLVAVALLQSAVAIYFGIGWWHELRDYLTDETMREISRPFFLLLTPTCTTLANVLLAIGASAALWQRRNAPLSRRLLLLAFAVALPLQVVPHLVPTGWSYAFPEEMREQGNAVLRSNAPLLAIGGFVDVLPLVLSITVGLSRAGFRHARLRPESPIGAMMAFAASVQLGLLATAALAFVEPLAPERWAAIGLVLIALHYSGAAAICFLLARDGHRRSRALRGAVTASAFLILLPGVVELLVGLWSIEVWDMHLCAWGDRPGLVTPEELPRHAMLFVARALVTAVAAYDLLARSNDSAA